MNEKTIPAPPPEDDGDLVLDVLYQDPDVTPPLSKAERAALVFHYACMKALDGQEISAGLFANSQGYKDAQAVLKSTVGNVQLANTIQSDWWYNNRHLFTKPKNIT